MIKNLTEIKDKFPRYFGVPFTKFYDGLLTVIFKRVMINLEEFSTWLDAPDGVSDLEYIEQKYGREAAQWFNKIFLEI